MPEFKVELSKRTSDYLSVYTVEMFAILMALEWGEQFRCADVVICSDSVSALGSIEKEAAKTQDLLILYLNTRMVSQGRRITFLWVPVHLVILGNERADKLAKKAVKKCIIIKIRREKHCLEKGKSAVATTLGQQNKRKTSPCNSKQYRYGNKEGNKTERANRVKQIENWT